MRHPLVGLAVLPGVAMGTALLTLPWGPSIPTAPRPPLPAAGEGEMTDAPSATAAQLAALQEILARPEFQVAEGRSILDRLLDPIRSWLRWLGWELLRLIGWLLEPASGVSGEAILYVIVGVALVILIGVALMLRRLMRGTLAGDAVLADASTAGRPRAADELARARAFAQAGDRRRAVHHQYRAVLLRLDERDHLPFDGTLTNRELVPRLTAAPTLVSRFDRLWYGQTDCSAEEYAAFAALSDRVWQAAGTVAPTHPTRGGTASLRVAPGTSSGAG